MTKWTPSTAALIFSWPTGFPAFSCRQMVSHQCPPRRWAKWLCQIQQHWDEVVVEAQKYQRSHSMRHVYLGICDKRQVNESTQITRQSHGNNTAAAQCVRRRTGGKCRFAKVKNTHRDGEELWGWCGFLVWLSHKVPILYFHSDAATSSVQTELGPASKKIPSEQQLSGGKWLVFVRDDRSNFEANKQSLTTLLPPSSTEMYQRKRLMSVYIYTAHEK